MKVFSNYSELISGYMTAKPSLKFLVNNLPPFCLYLKSRELIYHLNRYHVKNRMACLLQPCSIKYGGDVMLFLKKYMYNVLSCMFMVAFRTLDFIASFSR